MIRRSTQRHPSTSANPSGARRRWLAQLVAVALTGAGLTIVAATPAAAAPCDPGNNPVICENSKPGDSNWEVGGGGSRSIEGFATQMSVNAGETISFKARTMSADDDTVQVQAPYTIEHLPASGGTGGPAVASGDQLTPTLRNQPACDDFPDTGLVDCGNWPVSGVLGGAGGRRLRCLRREASAHRRRRATTTSRSSSATTPASPTSSSRPPTRPGRPTTTTAATASTTRRQPGRARLQGQLQPARSPPGEHADGPRLLLRRRVPDDPLAGAQRLRRRATCPASTADRRGVAAAQPQDLPVRRATTSTGRATSGRTSRRPATRASTSRSSAATRSSGRPAGSRSIDGTGHGLPHAGLLQGDEGQRQDRPEPGVDRHLARPAVQPARRRRPPGERADRHSSSRSTRATVRRSRCPATDGKMRFWRNTTRRRPRRRRRSPTLGRRHPRLRVGRGRGQRLPAGRPDPLSTTTENVPAKISSTTARPSAPGDGDPPPDAVPARRAARWSSAPAPSSGPGAWTTTTTATPIAGGPADAAGDGEPARRHGRPAGHPDGRPGRGHRRRPTPTRPTTTITAAGGRRASCAAAARSRSPARRPTPAAAGSPASRSPSTAASPGTRPPAASPGPTARTPAAPGRSTIQARAIDDSGNIGR